MMFYIQKAISFIQKNIRKLTILSIIIFIILFLLKLVINIQIKDIINIYAIIIGPIIAVSITKNSDEEEKKRNDKMQIFKTLITGSSYLAITGAWSTRCVEMLNQINLIFRDDKDVECNWRKYYNLLSDASNREGLQKERNQALFNMLNSMARSLGYKDFSLLEKDNILYTPNAMQIEIQNENQFKNLQLQTLSGFVKTFSENQSQKNNIKLPRYPRKNSIWVRGRRT